jgi:hypothetical protein
MSTTTKKNTPTTTSTLSSSSESSQESKRDNINEWLSQLYSVQGVADEEIIGWYEMFAYQGFNRDIVLKQLREKIPDVKLAMQAIILIALRGPQKAAVIPLSDKRSLKQLGIAASGGKGQNVITCQKIGAATADLAAYFLKKLNIPKRINSALPGWLQFPSAGSITMPGDLRNLHREFARQFSIQIGGDFNEQIYQQMELNSYLSRDLHLFET